MNAALAAMSTWPMETVNNSEKNGEQAIEKMAAAARALGWPEQIVDATRAQMRNITKMQIQMMDHMMEGGADQITEPDGRFAIGDALEAKVLVQLRPGRQLAKCRRCPNDGDESLAVLRARYAIPTISRKRVQTWAWPIRGEWRF